MELREKQHKRCGVEERAEAGDRWDHTAIAAARKLIVSLVVGQRTQEQTRAVVHDAKKRLSPRHLPAIFPDAYEGYASAILDAFGHRYPAPNSRPGGHPARPQLRWPQGLAYGQVKKRYQGRGLEQVEVRGVHGHSASAACLVSARLPRHQYEWRGAAERDQSLTQSGHGAQDAGLCQSDAVSPLDALARSGALQLLSCA